MLVETFDRLSAKGWAVTLGYAEDQAEGAEPPPASLYIFKSRSPLWLKTAEKLHAQGHLCTDPFPARMLVRDKLAATLRLQACGAPVPPTWLVRSPAEVLHLSRDRELVLKPRTGGAGQGITFLPRDCPPAIAWRGFEAASRSPPCEGVLAQERIPTRTPDIKLYTIGEAVFAARKAFGPHSVREPGTPYSPSPAEVGLARSVSEAIGAKLLGIDVVSGPTGPVVVDVNWFPAYRGFPEAPLRLVELFEAELLRGGSR